MLREDLPKFTKKALAGKELFVFSGRMLYDIGKLRRT